MSNGLTKSRSGSSTGTRDPAEVDGSRGYVSASEIRNVWSFRMRALDVEIWPRNGRTPSRDEILEFFNTIQIELMQRATSNFEQHVKRPPPQKPSERGPQEIQAEHDAHAARRGKLERWHQQ